MELDQVNVINLEPFEAAIDTRRDCLGAPGLAGSAAGHMAALGCQKIFVATVGDGFAYHLLGLAVAGGGVEEVDATVQRNVQDAPGGFDITLEVVVTRNLCQT